MADGDRRAVAWLTYIVRISHAPLPWRDVIRFPVSVVTPLAIGLALQGTALGAGLFAMMGALDGTLAGKDGPLRERLARTAVGVGFGVIGLSIGRYAVGGGWQAVLVVALVAGVCGLISLVNANLSFGSLQLLVYLAIGSGLATALPMTTQIGAFVIGGLWATLLTLLQFGTERADPDRAAVGAVFTAIGRLLADSATGGSAEEACRALPAALDCAYEQVIASRSHSAGRRRRLNELAAVLNSTVPLAEGTVALYRAGEPADPLDMAAVDALAAALVGDRRLTGPCPPPLTTGSPAARAVRCGVRLAWVALADLAERRTAAGVTIGRGQRIRLRDLADQTITSSVSRAFARRLALCMGIAEITRQHLPIPRPYWVLLTVAIVLKPDLGPVFARAVQRGAGTVLGVLLGALVLTLVPRGGWLLIPLVVTAAALPWAMAANYGLFSVFVTPLVLILLDFAIPGGAGLITSRLIDTVVGCGIVLIFGYLLWPRSWRAPLEQALRAAVLALDAFIAAAFTGSSADELNARRRTLGALADLQTQLQRRLAEPPPANTFAAGWWPLAVQLERTVDATVAAVIAVRSGRPAPDPAQVALLRQAIRQLGDDVGAQRRPNIAEVPEDSVLGPIASEIDAAHRLIGRAEKRGVGHEADPPSGSRG